METVSLEINGSILRVRSIKLALAGRTLQVDQMELASKSASTSVAWGRWVASIDFGHADHPASHVPTGAMNLVWVGSCRSSQT